MRCFRGASIAGICFVLGGATMHCSRYLDSSDNPSFQTDAADAVSADSAPAGDSALAPDGAPAGDSAPAPDGAPGGDSAPAPDGAIDFFVPDAPAGGSSLIFVTSTTYRPGAAFIGITGADEICAGVAKANNLDGAFWALLSDADTNAVDRIKPTYPVRTTDGSVVAATDLFSGTIANPVRDETGAAISSTVWTGTSELGTALLHCNSWRTATSSARGRTGQAGVTTADWINHYMGGGGYLCTYSWSLYCISVP